MAVNPSILGRRPYNPKSFLPTTTSSSSSLSGQSTPDPTLGSKDDTSNNDSVSVTEPNSPTFLNRIMRVLNSSLTFVGVRKAEEYELKTMEEGGLG